MAQTTELIEMADGVLTLIREGRKLVKVSYETKQIAHYRALQAMRVDDDIILKRCQECGTWLEENERGVWVDFSNRFLCLKSQTNMHRAAH